MIVMVFTRYSVGMGICLDLDETGAPALDLLTVDLPFTCRLFHVMTFPTSSVARTMGMSRMSNKDHVIWIPRS
jgi:hypothetical protein